LVNNSPLLRLHLLLVYGGGVGVCGKV